MPTCAATTAFAICAACAQAIVICRDLSLLTRPLAAIDGSKFKGVNARDKTFRTRLAELEERAAQYLTAFDAADRQESMDCSGSSGFRKLRDKLTRLKAQMRKLKALEAAIEALADRQGSQCADCNRDSVCCRSPG